MEIVRLKERTTLSVRYRTKAAELATGMGPVYGEIAAYMARKGIAFAGPPFAMYYNMDMEDLDVEIGFPVAAAAVGEGRVRPGLLPGGDFAVGKHVGPYSAMERTYDALAAFVKEQRLEPEEYMYEEYLNSPEDTPPERLETNVYFPLKA